MEQTYKATVDQHSAFDLTEEFINQLDMTEVNHNQFHVLRNHQTYQVEILSENFFNKNYTVKVNDQEFKVEISNQLDQLIKEMGFEVGATKQVNAIKAPMPGLILSINVEVGQEVQQNETLLILEAMKMENSFTSPRQGIIKSILVEQGQAVDKGQLLIEFE